MISWGRGGARAFQSEPGTPQGEPLDEQVKWATQCERRDRRNAETAAGTYVWTGIFEEVSRDS